MDRNSSEEVSYSIIVESLSARRAWIEMLRTGLMLVLSLSLSARRAWIEIAVQHTQIDKLDSRSPQGERG